MRLVCDTNVVFSGLIAGGKTRELLLTDRTDLSAPEFFFVELDSHREEIVEKSRLPADDLDLLLSVLFEEIDVVPREAFESELPEAKRQIADVDPDDVPFLALALSLDADLWSDDSDFANQSAVSVWKTHELVDRLMD